MCGTHQLDPRRTGNPRAEFQVDTNRHSVEVQRSGHQRPGSRVSRTRLVLGHRASYASGGGTVGVRNPVVDAHDCGRIPNSGPLTELLLGCPWTIYPSARDVGSWPPWVWTPGAGWSDALSHPRRRSSGWACDRARDRRTRAADHGRGWHDGPRLAGLTPSHWSRRC